MEETLFYSFGLTLTVAAIVVSFIGLRAKDFPKKAVSRLVVLVFAVLVVGTAASAVALSREEAEEREHERAEAELEELEPGAANAEPQEAPGEEAGGVTVPESAAPETPAEPPAPGTPLQLAADLEALAFDQDQLVAESGELVIDFDNPSDIPHNVVIEGEDGDLGGTPQISDDAATLRIDEIEPGEYTFYCSVLGHREAGMEGALTVE